MFKKFKEKFNNFFGKESQEEVALEEATNIESEVTSLEEVGAVSEQQDSVPGEEKTTDVSEEEKSFSEEASAREEEVSEIDEEDVVSTQEIHEDEAEQEEDEVKEKESSGFFKKQVTEKSFASFWEDIEIFLYEINVAFDIVETIKEKFQKEVIGKKFSRFGLQKKLRETLFLYVKNVLKERECDFFSTLDEEKTPHVVVFVGVNGSGKTTSIAKFAALLQKKGKRVVVACCDTFRAAAHEQLGHHMEVLKVPMIKHQRGSDPAAVGFDAVAHAKAKGFDYVLIDTAGRMPSNTNLAQELAKICRVSQAESVIYIGDSNAGNDLVEQITLFNKAVPLQGMILTKTDTDDKPGSLISAACTLELPIFFIGDGQMYDDLAVFDAEVVAKNLFLDE